MRELILILLVTILGILLLWISLERNTFKTYTNIDGCIYLTEQVSGPYSVSKSNALIGCDSLTISKYRTKIGLKIYTE